MEAALRTIETECVECNGSGKDEDQLPCEVCDGKGYLTREKLWVRREDPKFK